MFKQYNIEENELMLQDAVRRLLRALLFIMQQKASIAKIAPQTIKELLSALREARADLVSRSLNEDPQLFLSLFQYENDENLLFLAFEREYSIFVNNNIEKLCNHISNIESIGTKEKLKNITERLLSFRDSRSRTFVNAFFIKEKIKTIERMLSTFDNGLERLEKIKYIQKKDQTLFEREFKRLLGEQNDFNE
ncbi:hypothetical protein ACET57_19170 [Aeromonas veronii]|uniref:hypothetical protein n=1 Tax=Aeromonas veronii TaxID=654 RepID=UPI0038D29173